MATWISNRNVSRRPCMVDIFCTLLHLRRQTESINKTSSFCRNDFFRPIFAGN
ncbi:MAG: hypothetical protein FJY17_01420 [Bacteroidetes bacterium]|nr:hypothetical protein [Bacteroidota bacterium]